MKYLDMMKKAKSEGVASEKAMWKSVEGVDEILCVVKEEHPEMYMSFMRDQHEALYGPHYDKHFAEMDVDKIRYTNAAGEKKTGAHWNVDQIQEATKGMPFPNGTTPWDKYVAFNSFYADMCAVLDEATLLKGAYRFYFADEDAPAGKIWEYMTAMIYED
ncbi:hypothetical protein KQP56_18350 [Bacteroides thetaiotaomicron]|uniref:DUF7841 family protein n=1 Tax=Bacteroides thetaiotaomicron TaxID=818 RepID=UPI000E4BAB3B|nr:hypothetical protein [Bacteroides thetaiotaomicron]MBV3853175.1 hypothetical protein [Bacteroides thetaiotaomicron]MBV3926321.1 hypothetical protein [Bacteroides thetaiotaomicron]MBV3930398.1 hypothetical protein [Bacteroides thetaiotaomicron]MBV3939452.1 hypothetical protein [Bacteroides thetaiotaomicron]MBV3953775.1 hypothetical protein [Bacteroides thetaiotaomicron]